MDLRSTCARLVRAPIAPTKRTLRILTRVALPVFVASGDLPSGIYTATLEEVEERFGTGSSARMRLSDRLRRIHTLASATGHLARFVVFGSFVTAKQQPNDVDIVMVMDDDFDVSALKGEVALLFDHVVAQTVFGASVFWVRRLAALGGEADFIARWQVKRDGNLRGILEVRA